MLAIQPEVRFGFGENWLDFVRDLGDEQIKEAEHSLLKFLRCDTLRGQTFLDVGSGSGLFSLAARRLGARVHSFDYDPSSVRCTQELREYHFAEDPNWKVERGSILDRDYVRRLGQFDIVYAWGVLHHSGAMRDAIANAASAVAPTGLFASALYSRTRLCRLWRAEKRWYASASAEGQRRARAIYIGLLFRLRFLVRGRDFAAYVANYNKSRGMDFSHDVHDWLGGYPYESISSDELDALMRRLGFACVHRADTPVALGLVGSGCAEYLYRRSD
ncbi:bifunctional 2-polyprenyl-6-hydroxyphenol methylase/3-demethylubiquinol 3-O-methyltransferase UbiG [Bradyrhizobium sp. CCBAU 051011]|uniref:class I SAM-dependent methyltransferase n=1 Tax=Bradyrhizobium sp. CCBAU 051011 TaxID=858422 RepID=UPI00137A72BC|nr:class I SAM-dependent methyltransferase [Bradyrhizobium sp. CCBAU 051011]